MMKRIGVQGFVLTIAVVIALSLSARAQAAEGLYKAKCVACHAADGTGSAMGKKLGAHDFHTADVQKMSDEDLTEVIAKGKNKMPGYGKSLKPDEIKGLVVFIRSLAPPK